MKEATGLKFTGERFVPALDGRIKYEHVHRYALAMEFVAGKAVLDLASGEGYGAALLARVAESVKGVDTSPEWVEHARRSYYLQNLEFMVGTCDAVPLADSSVDVVTSFETIERHDRHEEMLSEIKRVLKPGGVLLISSLNRLTHSGETGGSNPFHVRKLYYDEFHDLLHRHFKHVCLYGHRLATGSFVYQLGNTQERDIKSFSGDIEHLTQQVCNLPSPVFFFAVCCDAPVAAPGAANSVYLDANDDLLNSAESERVDMFGQVREQFTQFEEHRRLEELAASQSEELLAKSAEVETASAQLAAVEETSARQAEELSRTQARLAAYEEQVSRLRAVERQVGKYEAQMAQQAEALAAAQAQASATEEESKRQAEELSKLHAQISSQRAQLNQLAYMLTDARVQLSNKHSLLSWMVHSRSWKITTPLRQLSLSGHRLRQKLPRTGRDVFRGYVDSPAEGATASGHIEVFGWAYSLIAPVARVEVFLDNMPLGAVGYGHARPDVVETYPSQAPLDCGYAGWLPLDGLLVGRRTLMIRVTDERGNFRDYTRPVYIESSAAQHVFEPPPAQRLEPAVRGGEGALVESLFGDNLANSKRLLSSMAETYLDSFLLSDAVIEFPQCEHPETSIIIVLYNRAELTLQCLYSILKSNAGPFEVIIVDNASTDETRTLLKRIRGARVIQNATNLHYLRACNQAARVARGRHLLLLNNDTQVLPNSISSALATLKSSEDIGAVGGKIILPDGTLQEAGSIVWRDGSCLGYGRGDSPTSPAYMFRRDVDYCSGAFLLTRRELFLEGGGFDETFAPAYYEETDYCARLWERGSRVVYDPNAIVLHYEFASSASQQTAVELQARHQKIFKDTHAEWLSSKPIASARGKLSAREVLPRESRRVLFLEDRVPHLDLGSGFPRSNRIITELVRMRHHVTLYPLTSRKEDWARVYHDIPREVEVIPDYGVTRLEEFLKERSVYYDYILISRPHNMATLRALVKARPNICGRAKIIYDAEALFSLRDIGQERLKGAKLSPEDEERLVSEEVRLAEGCHTVISVSEVERGEFAKHGVTRVHTLGHSITASPTSNGFDERSGILFVGSMHSLSSPNADSMIWFTEKVFPLIRRQLGPGLTLDIAGPINLSLKNRLSSESVRVHGKVEDLTALYNSARLFVAPTRFSAGIPHKAHEAAARGLPVVATTLIGGQLGWTHDEELLLADDEKSFAEACVRLYRDRGLWERLRLNALRRIETDCSPEAFAEGLRAIIE